MTRSFVDEAARGAKAIPAEPGSVDSDITEHPSAIVQHRRLERRHAAYEPRSEARL